MKMIYYDDGEYVIVDENLKRDRKDPSEIPQVLMEVIEGKSSEDIYFWEMSTFLIDILRVLYIGGYKPVAGNPEIKKMHERDFKYLITADLLPYTITIKRHKRATRIINADNICRDIGNVAVLMQLLGYAGEKRRAVTISSIARRIWSNFGSNDYRYLKAALPNAAGIDLGDIL